MKGLKKIILSRSRYDTITTHKLISGCVVLCPESEKEKYIEAVGDYAEVETLPDDVVGLAKVRNWCIKNYKEDVVMIDDDITAFYSMVRSKAYRIKNRDFVSGMLDNVYLNAKDSGTVLFGIGVQTGDIRKVRYTEPFLLKSWVGSIVGVIGKEDFFDESLKLRVDVDFSLKILMKYRRVWVDNRYSFFSKKNYNKGGSSILRSKENLKNDKRLLKERWGKYIVISDKKNTDSVRLNIDRTERNIF